MNHRILLIWIFSVLISFNVSAQSDKPKLVVGIVIDQMRWDYIARFRELLSDKGFLRLQREGFSCEQTFIDYLPSFTAPGHTCIYTGTAPSVSGIVGNDWYNKHTMKKINCVDDSAVSTVGSGTSAGKYSPTNLLVSTIGDELRLHTAMQSKVISIAIKNRAAILPGGHTATAAYWYDESSMKWITSSYYMKELPEWVNRFNDKNKPMSYLRNGWEPMLSMKTYKRYAEDDQDFEKPLPGENSVIFPHGNESDKKKEVFKYTPFAATYTFDLARTAIDKEDLGKRGVTDLLAFSISATDEIGHNFGPHSVEVIDAYVRLDKDLSSFLEYLDNTIGKGNYTVFLTADHGVAPCPEFLEMKHIPSGRYGDKEIAKMLNQKLFQQFSDSELVSKMINNQLYLNPVLHKNPILYAKVCSEVTALLRMQHFVRYAFPLDSLQTVPIPEKIRQTVAAGYKPERSGDIQIIPEPNYIERSEKGTTHGGLYADDTHIPLIWMGARIPTGKTHRRVRMSDIAATLAALLEIQQPNAASGKVITEIIP